jgi:hypothetical protein
VRLRRRWKDQKNWDVNMWNFATPHISCTLRSDFKRTKSLPIWTACSWATIYCIAWSGTLMLPHRRYGLSLSFVCSMTETLIRHAVGVTVSPRSEIPLTQIDRLLSFVERIKSPKSVPGTEAVASNVVNYRRLQFGHYFLPLFRSI